ncbi:hypothetical protein SDC9_210645 [bioreactor metagenome]|uniref:MoeA C-terminal domain-containing protein n=1 Tax=bioreactor metagenome TaxID=1076179 RepID=A0A645JI45_9ZZZZ
MASPLMLQRNGMLSGLLAANMLIDIPANHEPLAAGTNVEVLLL